MIRLVISQMAISKSIWGNLNNRLKNRGIRMVWFRRDDDEEEEGTGPNDAVECWRGRDMVGFMVAVLDMRTRWGEGGGEC